MSGKTIIRLQNIAHSFGKHVVHRNISFEIKESEIVTLLGPSGTGKTVILKMIIGLLYPTGGNIFVFDQDLGKMKEEELVKIRSQIGMLFQGAALFDSLSVYENIAYSLREKGMTSEEEISKIVKDRLSLIGLPGIEEKSPPALSGGQKKRVGLARALASSPRVMLFDEPTTGLDPTATRLIGDLILKLKNEFGITSLIVTHDIDTAKRISDRWILLNEGQVEAQGMTAELLRSNKPVIEFIEGHWQD
jgi:phospholipid/cholesterol/gamma-HCH transport system ATP-binding protein